MKIKDDSWISPRDMRALLSSYRKLLKTNTEERDEADRMLIRKAMDTAIEAHKDTKRKS